MPGSAVHPVVVKAYVVEGSLCRTELEYGPHDITITLDVMDADHKPLISFDGDVMTPSMISSYGWNTPQFTTGSMIDSMVEDSKQVLKHVWIAARDLN